MFQQLLDTNKIEKAPISEVIKKQPKEIIRRPCQRGHASFCTVFDRAANHDLAAYYSSPPRLPAYHPEQQMPVPRVVVNGSPLRDIAPCGSCHGSLDNKAGSPWLDGQPEAYIKAQLQDFKSGARHNDVSQQMRNVARSMTS